MITRSKPLSRMIPCGFGFTLLEMLVVLILVSLISTLLLQGFFYILQVRSRLLTQLEILQRGALQEHWFRSTVTAIVTDYQTGEHLFKGDKQQFSGLTMAALDKNVGVPTPFAWQLQYQAGTTVLRYQNSQDQYWKVAHWSGELGNFRYRAVDGEWHEQWPPQFGMNSSQLPQLIALEGQRRQTPITWIVKLVDRDTARIDYRLED